MTVNLLLFNLKYPFITWVLTHSALLQFHVWHLAWRLVPFLLNGQTFTVWEIFKKTHEASQNFLVLLGRSWFLLCLNQVWIFLWESPHCFPKLTTSPWIHTNTNTYSYIQYGGAHSGVHWGWYLLSCVSTWLQENADHTSCICLNCQKWRTAHMINVCNPTIAVCLMLPLLSFCILIHGLLLKRSLSLEQFYLCCIKGSNLKPRMNEWMAHFPLTVMCTCLLQMNIIFSHYSVMCLWPGTHMTEQPRNTTIVVSAASWIAN